MSQHLPAAEVLSVALQSDGPQQCIGRVTVRCKFCTQPHMRRVFDNDTIQFTRVAPCSSDALGKRYNMDLNLAVPKCNVSHEHIVRGCEAGRRPGRQRFQRD